MSIQDIPKQFIIQRYLKEGDYDIRICAFIQSHIETSEKGPCLSFTILPIENRLSSYKKQHKDTFGSLKKNICIPILCHRYATTNSQPYEFSTNIWFEGIVVSIEGRYIPMMNMEKACQILPSIFTYLAQSKYIDYQLIAEKESVDPSYAKFILGEIERYLQIYPKNICPITMQAFTKDTLCITPCGHGISYDAMCMWLQSSKTCPLCRSTCEKNDLLHIIPS